MSFKADSGIVCHSEEIQTLSVIQREFSDVVRHSEGILRHCLSFMRGSCGLFAIQSRFRHCLSFGADLIFFI